MSPNTLVKNLIYKKHYHLLIFLIPLLFLSTFLEIIGISLIPVIIGGIIDSNKVILFIQNSDVLNSLFSDSLINKINQKNFIVLFVGLFLFVFIVKNIVLLLIIYFENLVFYKLKVHMTQKLSASYFGAPYTFHVNSNSSTTIRNLVHEVKVASEYFRGIIVCIREVLVIFSILLTLFYLYPFTTLVALLFFLFVSGIFYFFSRNYLYKINKILFNIRKNFINSIQEGFGSIKSTLILQRESLILQDLLKLISTKEKLEFKTAFFSKIPRIYFELVIILTITTIIYITVKFDSFFLNTLPILATMAVAMVRLLPSFNNLSTNLVFLKSQKISAIAISNEFIRLKRNSKKKNIKSKLKVLDIYGDIKFKNVSFKYPNTNKYIFKNLNLEIKKNQLIGVIGQSGSGKTTLIDLLLGLLEPNSGNIKSNNLDIIKNIQNWRNILGYVPQDIYLIDDTIKRNIVIGLKDSQINKQKLYDSVTKSRINISKRNQKNFLNIKVGENGIKLSGGQKQRIGIARTLYKNPKIIIFDEATNSLDEKNEMEIIRDIKKFSQNRTIIFITHKMEILKYMDSVLLIKDNGKVVKNKISKNLIKHIKR